MTIQEVHNIIRFLLKKEVLGYVTPDQIDLAFNYAQVAELLDLAGDVQDFQPNSPVSARSYGHSNWISDELQPFILDSPISAASDGIIAMPSDYFRGLSLRYDNGRPINVITADKTARRLYSGVVASSPRRQTGELFDDGIHLRPARAADVILTYIRYPVDVLYSFSKDSVDPRKITFDAGTSTDPEWRDKSVNRIINRVQEMIGDHLEASV